MAINLFTNYSLAEVKHQIPDEEDMASAISKLVKLEASIAATRKEAAGEAADIMMCTGAYVLGKAKLKKLLSAAASADDAQFARALGAMTSKSTAKAEAVKVAAAE